MTSGSLIPDTRTKGHDLQTGLFFGKNLFLNHNDVEMLTFIASVGVLNAKLQMERPGVSSQTADEKCFKNIF